VGTPCRRGHRSRLAAGFDLSEHGGIACLEDHRHPFIHVELLDGAVLNRDLAGRFVDLRHLAVDHPLLGGGERRQ
jgi:hypothetical protein